jgi:hypothetical protein
MRQLFVGLIVAAFIVVVGAPAFAATRTITGRLIDLSCYNLHKSNTGVDHKMPKGVTKDCAISCAKKGRSVALLTSNGQVYTVTGGLAADKNAKLVPHLGHTVALTGGVTDQDGQMGITAANLKMISE